MYSCVGQTIAYRTIQNHPDIIGYKTMLNCIVHTQDHIGPNWIEPHMEIQNHTRPYHTITI